MKKQKRGKGKGGSSMIGAIAGIQSKMMAMQKEIGGMTFEGDAANKLVKAVVDGHGELKSVHIDPALAGEDVEILADLMVVATNQAIAQKEEVSKKMLKGVSSGMLPLGLKIPGL